MNKLTIFFFYFLIHLTIAGQEGLKPLSANLSYIYKPAEHANYPANPNIQFQKPSAASLFLPFKEDFSYAHSHRYPNPKLWLDSNVFVNTGYPIAPPSIGVATFDGLNKHGFPYTPGLTNLTQSLPADTLTSQPINLAVTATSQSLQVSDSIALSFYYQARGNGESPELNDNLILDFYIPAQNTWSNNVWSSSGNGNSNTNDSIFKRCFVWIKDPVFIKDGFKFRFRNTATTCGDFDHWHIDYVYLDKNRSELGDTVYNDLTFANIPTSFLKNYSAMPFEQYDSTEMANKISVRIKNNSAVKINYAYDFNIYNPSSQLIKNYSGGYKNLCPFKPSNVSGCVGFSGYSTEQVHSNPTVNYTFASLPDTTDFTIEHVLTPNGSTISGNPTQFFIENDTIIQYQKFRNYFALDDGQAEVGYYVNAVGGKMAMKFKLNRFDTLQAVRIYFDPVGNVPLAQSSYSFNIMLWSDGGSGPGTLLFTDVTKYPIYYNSGHKGHPEYKLTVTDGLRKLGPGTYYIGFQQKIATGITVGFDKNTDHHDMLYYDSGNGWTQSTFPGSIMIHPVFGKKVPAPVGISEITKLNLSFDVYPNPANESLYLRAETSELYHYVLTDALGRTILNGSFNNYETTVDTKLIPHGLYFLTIYQNGNSLHQQKIIVQH